MRRNKAIGDSRGTDQDHTPLMVLIGQSTCLGLSAAWLITAASTLFLDEFGAEKLPYLYMTVGVLVSAIFYGLIPLQKRISLTRLTWGAVSAFLLLVLLGWCAVGPLGQRWASFLLMALFPLGLQVGFVLLGSQAGRLFDVRQIKRLFPRIVTGFVVGFMVGGLAVSPVMRVTGGPEHLVLASAVALMGMLAFSVAAAMLFGARLNEVGASGSDRAPGLSLGKVIRSPYVALIFGYQMLSAMGSYLIEYMLLAKAAEQFPDPSDLAEFFGGFTAVMNFSNILFLALAAGFLLSRLGLRFGLTANPGAVLILLGLVLVSGLVPSFAGGFFWLLVATRVVDIVLTDGTTRTSLNAVYQSLPERERVTAQSGVEGIGVPIAVGLTGVVLLVATRVDAITINHVVVFTACIVIAWTIAGFIVFRGYASALQQQLTRSALGDADLSLAEPATRSVVEGLLTSPRVGEVRLALELLADSEEVAVDGYADALRSHPNPFVRTEVWRLVEARNVQALLPAAREAVDSETNAAVQGAAVRALCALVGGEAVEALQPLLAPEVPLETRRDTLVAFLRYGGISGVVVAARHLEEFESSPRPEERAAVADVIGAVANKNYCLPLHKLLHDDDSEVRRKAVVACGKVVNAKLMPLLVEALEEPSLRSDAAAALIQYGEGVVSELEKCLCNKFNGTRDKLFRLIHVGGEVGGARVCACLSSSITHPDLELRMHILRALVRAGFQASVDDDVQRVERVIAQEAEDAARRLRARINLDTDGTADSAGIVMLKQSIDDELDESLQRMFLNLSFLYDSDILLGVEAQLRFARGAVSASALETLEVVLSSSHKQILFALAEPGVALQQREKRLTPQRTAHPMTVVEQLRSIVLDPDGLWNRRWLQACAVWASADFQALQDVLEVRASDPDPLVAETASWAAHSQSRT